MVAEIKERLVEELDYRLRGDATSSASPTTTATTRSSTCPTCSPALSTARVLTTELVTGATWHELLTWDQHERDLAGECLFRFVFRSLYGMHAFNGDPHPGNYLFHGDGTRHVPRLRTGQAVHRRPRSPRSSAWSAPRRTTTTPTDVPADPRGRRDAAAAARRPATTRSASTSASSTRACATTAPVTWTQRVRQPHRAPHVRPHQPDRAVRDRAAGVRVHPADQPRPVRAARRAAARPATTAASPRSCGRSSHGPPSTPMAEAEQTLAGDPPDPDRRPVRPPLTPSPRASDVRARVRHALGRQRIGGSGAAREAAGAVAGDAHRLLADPVDQLEPAVGADRRVVDGDVGGVGGAQQRLADRRGEHAQAVDAVADVERVGRRVDRERGRRSARAAARAASSAPGRRVVADAHHDVAQRAVAQHVAPRCASRWGRGRRRTSSPTPASYDAVAATDVDRRAGGRVNAAT